MEHCIKNNIVIIEVILSKWQPTTRTPIESLRAQFDQLQTSTLARKQVHSDLKLDKITPSASFAICSPVKPTTPAHIGELNKNDHKVVWKKSMYEAYTKKCKGRCLHRTLPN